MQSSTFSSEETKGHKIKGVHTLFISQVYNSLKMFFLYPRPSNESSSAQNTLFGSTVPYFFRQSYFLFNICSFLILTLVTHPYSSTHPVGRCGSPCPRWSPKSLPPWYSCLGVISSHILCQVGPFHQ